jgi:hypothetical protein
MAAQATSGQSHTYPVSGETIARNYWSKIEKRMVTHREVWLGIEVIVRATENGATAGRLRGLSGAM